MEERKVAELLEQIVSLLQKENKKKPEEKYRELLKAEEIASAWHKHPNFIKELKERGLLLGLKRGKATYYTPEEVRAFEDWWQGKDLSDLDHIVDQYTGELVPHRFYSGNSDNPKAGVRGDDTW